MSMPSPGSLMPPPDLGIAAQAIEWVAFSHPNKRFEENGSNGQRRRPTLRRSRSGAGRRTLGAYRLGRCLSVDGTRTALNGRMAQASTTE